MINTAHSFYKFPFRAMGTTCALQLTASSFEVASSWAALAIAEVERLEQKYSRYLPHSILSQINANAGQGEQQVDAETCQLFNYAASSYLQSDGLFDISSGVLRRAWNFKKSGATSINETAQLPTQSLLTELLAVCGWQKVAWDGEQYLNLPAGFELDLGGLVKEYAADRAKAVLQNAQCLSALIDLGGDITAYGRSWRIGIKDPFNTKQAKAQFELHDGALATSGNYERTLTINGRCYSHLLNPKTGWPIDSAISVSVIADNCLIAGTVSTIAMLAGRANTCKVLDEFELPYYCVFDTGDVVDCLA